MQCISETSECTGKSAEKPTEQNGIKAEDAQSCDKTCHADRISFANLRKQIFYTGKCSCKSGWYQQKEDQLYGSSYIAMYLFLLFSVKFLVHFLFRLFKCLYNCFPDSG